MNKKGTSDSGGSLLSENIKLHHRWVKTWPDAENDFSAFYERETIGRIYQYQTGPQKDRWFWTMTALADNRQSISCDGIEPTAREAAKCVEDAFGQLSV